MIEKNVKPNETLAKALETANQTHILIGEVRDSDVIRAIIEANEYDSGHNVVTTMMCANPSEAVTKMINKLKSHNAMGK